MRNILKNTKRLKVRVHANSSQEKVSKLNDFELEVWIKEKPLDGKANLALEKFLKKELGVRVKVVSGFSSRNKILELFKN